MTGFHDELTVNYSYQLDHATIISTSQTRHDIRFDCQALKSIIDFYVDA